MNFADLTEVAKGKPLFIVALGVPYFADIKQESNTAFGDREYQGRSD